MLTSAKKVLSLVLVLTMLFSLFVIPSSAVEEEENSVMPCFTVIDSVITSFTISGLVATASVSLISTIDSTLYISIELQKEKSTGYETIEEWTTFDNGYVAQLEESRLINAFADYRIKVTCIAANEQFVTYDYP